MFSCSNEHLIAIDFSDFSDTLRAERARRLCFARFFSNAHCDVYRQRGRRRRGARICMKRKALRIRAEYRRLYRIDTYRWPLCKSMQ